MPIVYVHGVAVRDDKAWSTIELFLRRYIAPAISNKPDQVWISQVYWGDRGAHFSWEGRSRPKSPVLGMGANSHGTDGNSTTLTAQYIDIVQSLPRPSKQSTSVSGIISAGPTLSQNTDSSSRMLRDLSPQELCEMLTTTAQVSQTTPLSNHQRVALSIAVDEVSNDLKTRELLKESNDSDGWKILRQRVSQRYVQEHKQLTGVVAQGGNDFLESLFDRAKETIWRATGAPGFLLTRMAAEFRGPMNTFISTFIGDVFIYLKERGDFANPGQIPLLVLRALTEARKNKLQGREPLIVLSHSMGGQIVYDVVSHFLPRISEYKHLVIDFWCATASQVGLFEELKLFIESDRKYCLANNTEVPFPSKDHLKAWWNVWDHNDFISFSVNGIVKEVTDESYSSGMFALPAHSGYLARPSFYRAMASKISETCPSQGWW